MKQMFDVWEYQDSDRVNDGLITLNIPGTPSALHNKNNPRYRNIGTVELEITPPKTKKTVYRYAIGNGDGGYTFISYSRYENDDDFRQHNPTIKNFQRVDFSGKEMEE